MQRGALLTVAAMIALSACSNSPSDNEDRKYPDEYYESLDYINLKRNALPSLSYGGMNLPKYRSETDFFSPEYVYNMGVNAKRLFDEDADDERLIREFVYLTPYEDCGDRFCISDAGYVMPEVIWNDDGSISEINGSILAHQSPKKFRASLERYCKGNLVINNGYEFSEGHIEGKYADCEFSASGKSYNSINVSVKYKK